MPFRDQHPQVPPRVSGRQTIEPLFLERRSYRRRRLADAARLLPLLGAALFLSPVLWFAEGGAGPGTAAGGIYLFAVWTALILGAAVMSRGLTRNEAPHRDPMDSGQDS